MAERSRSPPTSAEVRWSFPPDVPTRDLLRTYDLADHGSMEWLPDVFIHLLGRGEFWLWEAVVRREQGLPLTGAQRTLVGKLLDFNDDIEDRSGRRWHPHAARSCDIPAPPRCWPPHTAANRPAAHPGSQWRMPVIVPTADFRAECPEVRNRFTSGKSWG